MRQIILAFFAVLIAATAQARLSDYESIYQGGDSDLRIKVDIINNANIITFRLYNHALPGGGYLVLKLDNDSVYSFEVKNWYDPLKDEYVPSVSGIPYTVFFSETAIIFPPDLLTELSEHDVIKVRFNTEEKNYDFDIKPKNWRKKWKKAWEKANKPAVNPLEGM